jgi:fumarate reductase subunit D
MNAQIIETIEQISGCVFMGAFLSTAVAFLFMEGLEDQMRNHPVVNFLILGWLFGSGIVAVPALAVLAFNSAFLYPTYYHVMDNGRWITLVGALLIIVMILASLDRALVNLKHKNLGVRIHEPLGLGWILVGLAVLAQGLSALSGVNLLSRIYFSGQFLAVVGIIFTCTAIASAFSRNDYNNRPTAWKSDKKPLGLMWIVLGLSVILIGVSVQIG